MVVRHEANIKTVKANTNDNYVVSVSHDPKTSTFESTMAVVKAVDTIKIVNTKIRGKELDTSKFIMHETPTPATNGSQKVFTVANAYVSGLLEVYLDGLMQIKGTDYTETSSTTFTMVEAPDSDEVLRVNYIKQ